MLEVYLCAKRGLFRPFLIEITRKMLINKIISAILFVVREGREIMSKVVVKNGNVEGALKNLKLKNAKDGSLRKARERQEGYMKPGVRRRIEKKENIINSRKRNRNNY